MEAPLTDATEMLRLRRAAPVLALLLLAALFSWIGLKRGDVAAPHADVTTIPTSFGPWIMTGSEQTDKNLAFSASLVNSIGLDSYTDRNYVNQQTGQQIQLLVEYRRLGRGAFTHRPEACYPAAGYTLSGRHITSITYGGRAAHAITSIANYNGVQGYSHQVLLYWFGTGNRVVSNFVLQQIEMALGRLNPSHNGWAFVRIISECRPGQEAAALAGEKDFVQQASPALIHAISTPVTK